MQTLGNIYAWYRVCLGHTTVLIKNIYSQIVATMPKHLVPTQEHWDLTLPADLCKCLSYTQYEKKRNVLRTKDQEGAKDLLQRVQGEQNKYKKQSFGTMAGPFIKHHTLQAVSLYFNSTCLTKCICCVQGNAKMHLQCLLWWANGRKAPESL